LELVWIFGYFVVTSTLVTFRVQTRHSMIKWHQEQFLFIVTSFTRLWDSPTNYDDSIFSLSCAKSTKLSFLKALLQRFLRFFDPCKEYSASNDAARFVNDSFGILLPTAVIRAVTQSKR
jgi:hypothetical protein